MRLGGSSTRLGVAGVVALAMSLAAVANAGAATVGFTGNPYNAKLFDLDYKAAGGEPNRLTLSYMNDENNTIDVTDPGATINVGPGCLSLGANRALCTTLLLGLDKSILRTNVDLGDLNDSIWVSGRRRAHAIVRLGDGQDRYDETIAGQVGATIYGDAGDDIFRAGTSPDGLIGGPGADDLGGGGGPDRVDYFDDPTPRPSVFVAADGSPNDGAPGEGDNVHNDIEILVGSGVAPNHLIGGPARDSLIGGGADDLLEANGGEDYIVGRDGDDQVDAGPGPDLILADEGDDTIRVRDGEPDSVVCGPGNDLAIADPFDHLTVCESVDIGP